MFVAKSKALLEFENFSNEKLILQFFSLRSCTLPNQFRNSFNLTFTLVPFPWVLKTNALPVLAIFTGAFKVKMVNSPLVRTELLFFLLVGEIHSTGYTYLTTLYFLFLMKIFDNFTLKLFEMFDAKMLSTFS